MMFFLLTVWAFVATTFSSCSEQGLLFSVQAS